MVKKIIYALITTLIYLIVSNAGNLFLEFQKNLVGQRHYGNLFSFYICFALTKLSKKISLRVKIATTIFDPKTYSYNEFFLFH